ncbi:MAG: hypothetical protein NZM38_04970 [Cytophagales bacterium]|nr:hypothetical protein [Cytophagales bacterium]MDW8384104.1 hypothetical protein [Flammeovirgaceae bacterium]
MFRLFFLLAFFTIQNWLQAQYYKRIIPANPIKDIILKIDTLAFSYQEDTIHYLGSSHLPLRYEKDDEICELNIFLQPSINLDKLELLPSVDFEMIDSLIQFNYDFYRTRLKFHQLTNSKFISLIFRHKKDASSYEHLTEIKLLPYQQTIASIYPKDKELYIGEEKIFEIATNHPQNIFVDNLWKSTEKFDYRITRSGSKIRLHIVAKELGLHKFVGYIPLAKPVIQKDKQVSNFLTIEEQFDVRSSRLAFLEIEPKDITLDESLRKTGIEVQISNHRQLKMQRTYRLEAKEEPGGALIAELFTKAPLSNDQVLCILRPYEHHKSTEGYLYIKDRDEAKFLTNFSISPKTQINQISILREGREWTNSLVVNPGEIIYVKLEGVALHKGQFKFLGATQLKTDSSVSENMMMIKLKIPLSIANNKIEVLDHDQPTGFFLIVKEYQRPHAFDFITIDYGNNPKYLHKIVGPILYNKPIRDIVIDFDRDSIDSREQLYGKQIFSIDIKITNVRGQLVDLKRIDRVTVCPENCVREAFYRGKDCQTEPIRLNNIVSTKTFDLEDWSKIELFFQHLNEKYESDGYRQKTEIYLQRLSNFDIDVSFPAGLIIKKFKENRYGTLGGVSLAVIAQFKFYRPEKIAQLRPYRIGIGTIALDAFNFSSNNTTTRDLGIVVLGSIFPQKRDTKLSFPLYGGFGYLMQADDFFFLLGPGIRISL